MSAQPAEISVGGTDEFLAVVSEQTTGGHVWHAARHLLSYFHAHPHLLSRASTLIELGAGTGFLGMSLAVKFDVGQVVLTEMPQGGALEWLAHNVERNRRVGHDLSTVRTAAFDWAWIDHDAKASSASAVCDAATQEFDRLCSTTWDFVLGSDLVYNESGVNMLPRVLATLAQESTKVLYAHTLNRFEFLDRDFFEALASVGLQCRSVWPEDGEEVNFGSAAVDYAVAHAMNEQDGFSGELFPEQRVVVLEISRRQA